MASNFLIAAKVALDNEYTDMRRRVRFPAQLYYGYYFLHVSFLNAVYNYV